MREKPRVPRPPRTPHQAAAAATQERSHGFPRAATCAHARSLVMPRYPEASPVVRADTNRPALPCHAAVSRSTPRRSRGHEPARAPMSCRGTPKHPPSSAPTRSGPRPHVMLRYSEAPPVVRPDTNRPAPPCHAEVLRSTSRHSRTSRAMLRRLGMTNPPPVRPAKPRTHQAPEDFAVPLRPTTCRGEIKGVGRDQRGRESFLARSKGSGVFLGVDKGVGSLCWCIKDSRPL